MSAARRSGAYGSRNLGGSGNATDEEHAPLGYGGGRRRGLGCGFPPRPERAGACRGADNCSRKRVTRRPLRGPTCARGGSPAAGAGGVRRLWRCARHRSRAGGAPHRPDSFHRLRRPGGRRNCGEPCAPRGNITGLSDRHADAVTQRLELLKEVAPAASRVAVFFNANQPNGVLQLNELKTRAPAFGLAVQPVSLTSPAEHAVEQAFAAVRVGRPDGILIIGDPVFSAPRPRIAALALELRVPAIGTVRQTAEAGFLMSYGTTFVELWRRAAVDVDKVLKGATPR
jgi:hypothetical protein